jgi:osmoprotectant transport system substrate-binding protein
VARGFPAAGTDCHRSKEANSTAGGCAIVEAMHRVLLVALTIGLLACSRQPGRSVVVASLNTTEQTLLGEIIAQQVENRLKTPVDRISGGNDPRMINDSLLTGQADLMPQYLNDAFIGVLRLPPTRNQSEIRERVRTEYEQRFQCEWTPPLGLHHAYVMVIDSTRPEYAALHKLTDAVPVRPGWNLGVSDDFLRRPDGIGAMMNAYDLRWRGAPQVMDAASRFKALRSEDLDIIAANLTDGQLLDPGLRTLSDDQNVFMSYETAVVARTEALNRYPGLREALKELSGKFHDDQVRGMNAEIDSHRQTVREVARQFLKSAGLN